MCATAKPRPRKPQPTVARWLSVSRFTFRSGASALLDIGGTVYGVRAHHDGGRVAGWRLTKEDGTTYDVCLDGHGSCECLGYLRWNHCKHLTCLPQALAELQPAAA